MTTTFDPITELRTLRRAVGRLQLKLEQRWRDDEYIAIGEGISIGMTLSRAERDALERCKLDNETVYPMRVAIP